MFPAIATIAGLLAYVGGPTDTIVSPTCKYDVNRTVAHQISADSQLYDVIAYLRHASIPFDLFTNREQRIKSSEIETFDYERVQPVKLIVGVEGERQPNLVKETELLILVFGEGKHISSASCEKFYTGL